MSDESAENRIYQGLVEDQVRVNEDLFCPMRRERQMDHLFGHLARDLGRGRNTILDMCGGYGRLTHFMLQEHPEHEYYCFDSSATLIARAKQNFAEFQNVHCDQADLYALSPRYDKAFDITILYKTLYCLPYYLEAILQLVNVTRKRIYITSPFYEGDIDFISRIYPSASAGNEGAYHYSNSYSIPKFAAYCRSLGVKEISFEDMRLDLDLPAPQDKNRLQTHTVRTVNQGRLEITGALLLNWKLAILSL